MESYFATTPERPGWITSLPLLGRRLGAAWDQVVQAKDNLGTLLEPYTADVQQFMISAARALADSVLQVLLSLIVAMIFWTNGDALVAMLHDALRRLGGLIAEQALDVAAGAIRTPTFVATIIGKTDSVGSAEFNEHLSQRRAEAVFEALVYSHKLPENRGRLHWTGERLPYISTADEQAESQNRMVAIIVSNDPSRCQ